MVVVGAVAWGVVGATAGGIAGEVVGGLACALGNRETGKGKPRQVSPS